MKLIKLNFLKQFKKQYFNHIMLFGIFFCTKYNKLKVNKSTVLIKTSMGFEHVCNLPICLFIEGLIKKSINLKMNPTTFLTSKKTIYFNWFYFLNYSCNLNRKNLIKNVALYISWLKYLNQKIIKMNQGISLRLRMVGYARRALYYKNKKILLLKSGHSYTDRLRIPNKLHFKLIKKRFFYIYGIDTDIIFKFSRNIYRLRPVDPYKGGGIRYVNKPYRKKIRRVKV